MRFAQPAWLLLALPVLGLAVLFWLRRRRPDGIQFSSLRQMDQIHLRTNFGPDEILGGLVVAGLLFAVVALARPQAGTTTQEISGRGLDIVLCLDTSGSMRSEDFKPQNRLGAAKEVAKGFISGRPHDRLGLVVFGGIAMTVCPLTADKGALQDFLQQVQIDMTGADGTAMGIAMATAVDRLRESKAASRVILLLTDGRNNLGAIDPLTAAKAAAAFGIKIYAVGAGSPQGGMMPVQDPVFGLRYVKVDNDLDEEMLSKIAALTHGAYFRAKDSQGLKKIFERINQLEKSEYKISDFTHYRDLYPGWLALAWLLLAGQAVLRNTVFRRIP